MACNSIPNGPFTQRPGASNDGPGEVSPNSAAAVIEAGDFVIDVPARRVTLRGGELGLTSAEFEVLVFLAGHPKSFVTPHTMLATNWTNGQVRQAEFLRALTSLTKKLDSATGSSQHYIRTEPWIFYRFDPSSA